jgi:putative tryptophan/tyrosine transport system substrate-binding protein
MKRRDFITLLGGVVVALPLDARAQEPGRTYRIGALWGAQSVNESLYVSWRSAFLDPARRHGFVEGQNLTLDDRVFASPVFPFSEWADELVKGRVDVIVPAGDLAIRAAQNATKTTPILGITDDMLGAGLVTSLARPDGNTTGVSILATELDGKRQEILIEAVPGLRRMAALADPNKAAVKLEALREAARARNIELSVHRVVSSEEIVAAINTVQASGPTALNVLASPLLYANRKLIMDRANALSLPAIYQWPETAAEGGFAAYGPSLVEVFREPYGRQLVQLLRGTKLADIPVEQPTKFELVINLKTAKAMGVTVPEGLLARADKVIE